MTEGFRERAERVNALLGEQPQRVRARHLAARDAVDEAIFFHRRLRDAGLPFAGAVANRVHAAGRRADAVAPSSRSCSATSSARRSLRTYDEDAPPGRARPPATSPTCAARSAASR